jgi:transposase
MEFAASENPRMPKLGRPLPELKLSKEERQQLESILRRRRVAQADAKRAKVIMLAAEGCSNTEILRRTGLSAHTVGKWRRRFLENRLRGLSELPRWGAPRRIGDDQVEKVIRLTLESVPPAATHWSTRKMAQRCGLSRQAVSRIWRAFGLRPHRSEVFTLSEDPYFVDKVRDVVGLYMDPPDNALVLCVDEKTQVQALERSQPVLPMRPGRVQRHTHDYYRHGTVSLFAALEVATGRIISSTKAKHRSSEFVAFLRQIEREVPADLELHIVLDNYATHKTDAVENWLGQHPRWHLHFIPTHSSWLNQVERFFAKITTERIRRGVFKSVEQLKKAIEQYIAQHNEDPKPFHWTANADLILGKVKLLCNELR